MASCTFSLVAAAPSKPSFCLESSSSSCSPSTSARCLPSLCVSGGLPTRSLGRNFRMFQLPTASGRSLKQKLSCTKDSSPTDCQSVLHFSDNGECSSTKLFSLLPLLSRLIHSDKPLPSSRRQRHGVLRVVGMARHKGRVGTYKREGNVSLASFGIKAKRDKKEKEIDITKTLSMMLPFVVATTAVAALTRPASFAWVSRDYYAPALGGIMLSIGVQLSVEDFALVVQRPLPVLIGYTTQYVVKPLLGFTIVKLFSVPAAFASGLILTSCVAGAQLSSYAAFLSEGDVALSIVLTSLTTISSVAITPLLTRILIGSVVPVDVVAMATSILQVVIAPVFLGLALNTYAKPLVNKVRSFMPLVAMVCTSLCIGSPLALNRDTILSTQGLQLMVPVLAFHIGAFILGYWISRVPFWRQGEKECRTVSLCTGMQSSTLAMLLASQFLGSSNAVPPACSVVVMALMGLSLASFWGKGNQLRDLVPSFVTADNRSLGLI